MKELAEKWLTMIVPWHSVEVYIHLAIGRAAIEKPRHYRKIVAMK